MSEVKTRYREPWYLSNDNDTEEWCITDGVETFPLKDATATEFGLALKGTIERAQVVPQPNRETIAALLGISDEYFDAIQGGERENWMRLIDHLWKVSEALKAVSSPPPAPLSIDREAPTRVTENALRDAHARYHDQPGNLFGKDECGWERCEFWDAAKFALSAQPVEGEVEVDLDLDDNGEPDAASRMGF